MYEIENVPLLEENDEYLSINLGINNNFICYDSNGERFIINGFLNAMHYYDK